MLRLVLAIPIILLPNALHLPLGAGVAGLNLSNLLFVLLVCALLLSGHEWLPAINNRRGYLTAPLVALFLTLAMAFVSTLWDDVSHAREGLIELKNLIFYPLLYFVYRRCRQDLRSTRQLIFLVLLVAAGAAVEAIAEGLQFEFGRFVDTQRAAGPFGDSRMANRAGVFYAMFLPMFAAIALLLRQHRRLRIMAVTGCLILGTAIMFTFSRQSYLIALAVMLLMLMYRSVPAAILAAVLMFASVTLLPDSVTERVQSTRQVNISGESELDPSTASRFEIWKGALDMVRDHPGGVGLGRFPSRIGQYSNHPRVDAHNGYILVLAECGVLGLAAMLWMFWRLWGLARRLRRCAVPSDLEARAIGLGFTFMVIAMALSNVYGSPFFHGLIMANVWVLCGLLERYAALKVHAATATTLEKLRKRVPPMGERFPLAARAMPGLGAPRPAPVSRPRLT